MLDQFINQYGITLDIYSLADSFPTEEKYGLISQIRRCAVSIPSNIAEGCSGTNKSLINYLSIALGSSFELETQLIIAGNLNLFSEKSNELFEKNRIASKTNQCFQKFNKIIKYQSAKAPKR